MPKLSLYRPNKQNDYRFIDRTVAEQLTVGGTDLYIHKYLGPQNQGPSTDATQPQYATLSPTNIQDLLFLENRDRIYDKNIYRLRGHYNVQNLDFDLSQFGLFLNNNIIFITVHYNDMIDLVGRKLMVGDVLELPHLIDYNPLDETIPVALKRFYQITDATFASEGFSPTWFPHMWRIKCEQLVDSEEFSDILKEPVQQDNYLGNYDKVKTYPAGYTITFGDKVYRSIIEVPAGITPPNTVYWVLEPNSSLSDILATYNKNIAINNAQLEEANRLLPKSGYDTSKLYIVPTYGLLQSNTIPSNKYDQPAPPYDTVTSNEGIPTTTIYGSVYQFNNPKYKTASYGLKISKDALKILQGNSSIGKFIQVNLSIITQAPSLTSGGSGPVSGTQLLQVETNGIIIGPYGTADNTYATADQDPDAPGFTGTEPYGPNTMDYRADCDPRFQYIARSTPRTFGYSMGYLTGDGAAPNGSTSGAGISFPQNPQVGDYFLRIDYMPQLLYRWDGILWIRISENVRTETGFTITDQSQLSTFINDENQIYVNNDDAFIPEAQPLSSVLAPALEPLPPVA
jgi:hypothetical protein